MWPHLRCISHNVTSFIMCFTSHDITHDFSHIVWCHIKCHLGCNLLWFFFSFQFFFHVSHHFASNVKWCEDKRFRLDPPNLFIQNLVWNAQTYKTSWIMRFGENNFFNTPWWQWWNSIPPIVVSLWWTPPLLLLLLLLLFYCWACWVGFNKESEQQHERNK